MATPHINATPTTPQATTVTLTHKTSPWHVISSLAGISVPIEAILEREELEPGQLVRIRLVAETLLLLRTAIEGQRYGQDDFVLRVAEHVADLANSVVNRARQIMLSGPAGADVNGLLDSYCDAVEMGLCLLERVDSNLAKSYEVAVRWAN